MQKCNYCNYYSRNGQSQIYLPAVKRQANKLLLGMQRFDYELNVLNVNSCSNLVNGLDANIHMTMISKCFAVNEIDKRLIILNVYGLISISNHVIDYRAPVCQV